MATSDSDTADLATTQHYDISNLVDIMMFARDYLGKPGGEFYIDSRIKSHATDRCKRKLVCDMYPIGKVGNLITIGSMVDRSTVKEICYRME